jgi:cytochrome c biogenesis protein CcmG/thiol:disulfide interchange protein DsbE
MINKVLIFLFLISVIVGCGSSNPNIDLISKSDRVTAPEIDASFINSSPINLEKLKGKVVVLDFWATWCPPCRMEIPSFIKLYQAYHSRGLEIVGLTIEAPSSQPQGYFRQFLREAMINYPVGFSSDKTTKTYDVEVYPMTFFIDKTGKVARIFRGARPEEEIVGVIEKLLAE